MKLSNKSSLATITLLTSCYCSASMADESITSLSTITSFGEQTSLQERQQSPNGMIVVDQTEIDRFNERTAGDVLRRLPGVVFGGAAGESKDVRVRGLDKEYSQVLINGRRIPGGGEKREFQLDQLPVDLIERIEVIRSPSADMDSQGIAGTINIILKNIPQEPIFSFNAGGSQIKGQEVKPNISLSYGEQADNFGYLLNINAQQRQLLKDKTKESFKADGSADKKETETEVKEFDEVQLAPRFSWVLSERDTLNVEPLLLSSKEDKIKEKGKFKANGDSDGKELEDENKERLHWAVNTQWQHVFTSGNEFTLGLNVQESQENKDKEKQAFKGDDSLDKVTDEREDKSDKEWLLSLSGKKFMGDQHALKMGIEVANKDRVKDKTSTEIKNGTATDKTEGKDLYEITEQRINAYILDEYSLSERHLLTPGMRVEWTETDVTSGAGDEEKNEYAFWSPSLHYVFKISEQTNVRSSIARTVRRPKFDEIVPFVETNDGDLNKPDKAGNPDLVSEVANGIDIGADHYFADRLGNVGINVFYRDISDKIETRVSTNTSNGRVESKPENVGEATLKGVELDASSNMAFIGLDNLTLKGNITFLDGEVVDIETGAKTPFKEQADYVYNLGFDHQLPTVGVQWGMNLNAISERETDKVEDGKRTLEILKSEQNLNLYVRKSLGKDYELRFSVQNILEVDKDKHKTGFNTDGTIDKTETELETSDSVFFLSFSGKW